MKLEGIHHVTAITADAPRNVDFYARVLGLRLVKKTVNQDDPTVYHLFYADERGDAGSDITFFEYPGARRGRARRRDDATGSPGASPRREALDFWAARLEREGVERASATTAGAALRRPRGSRARAAGRRRAGRAADRRPPGDPAGAGAAGASTASAPTRATPTAAPRSSTTASASRPTRTPSSSCAATTRGGALRLRPGHGDAASAAPAPSTTSRGPRRRTSTRAWRERVAEAGAQPTPLIDRYYFKSIYFREPSGVLFEIATLGPGFTADEQLETLGEALRAAAQLRAPARPDRARR